LRFSYLSKEAFNQLKVITKYKGGSKSNTFPTLTITKEGILVNEAHEIDEVILEQLTGSDYLISHQVSSSHTDFIHRGKIGTDMDY
jgi:hypothetical protein